MKKLLEPLIIWWEDMSEVQRDHLKILVRLLVASVVLYGGYLIGTPIYKKWQVHHAMGQAKDFVEQKDFRNALLSLRRATEYNLGDASVWQEVAKYLDSMQVPEVMVARQNIVALAPENNALRLALVQDSLKFGDMETAKSTINTSEIDVDYYRMAAALAYAMGKMEQLEFNLQEVVNRVPEDYENKFILAAIRLWGADTAKSKQGQQELKNLLGQPKVRIRAAIELFANVGLTGSKVSADQMTAYIHKAFLGKEPMKSKSDEPPGWTEVIDYIKSHCDANLDFLSTARWLSYLKPTETAQWLDKIADKRKNDPTIKLLMFDLALKLKDEKKLKELVNDKEWAHLSDPTWELIKASRWQGEHGFKELSNKNWECASTLNASSMMGMRLLTRIASSWGLTSGLDYSLSTIIANHPTERWALMASRNTLVQRKETSKLLSLYQRWYELEPKNTNIAQTWCMLNILTKQLNPHALAMSLYGLEPTNVGVITCLAASFCQLEKYPEALKTLDQLPREAKAEPRVILWRSLAMSKTGQVQKAKELLTGMKTADFLPEETTLLAQVKEICGVRN